MQGASPAALAGCRVLILDHDPCAAEDLQHALWRVGAEVVGPAASVAEAMALLDHAGSIDVAILEIEPGQPGAAAVGKTLRAHGTAVLLASSEGAAAAEAVGEGLPCAARPVDLRQAAAALWLSADPS